jgi:hypothetical protein
MTATPYTLPKFGEGRMAGFTLVMIGAMPAGRG